MFERLKQYNNDQKYFFILLKTRHKEKFIKNSKQN